MTEFVLPQYLIPEYIEITESPFKSFGFLFDKDLRMSTLPDDDPEKIAWKKAAQERRARVEQKRRRKHDRLLEYASHIKEAAKSELIDALLSIHKPDSDNYCTHCLRGPYEAEPVPYPCATVKTIAKHYGVTKETK